MSMTEEEFWAIMAPTAPPPPVFYRLYHDEKGYPLFFSMEDLPGNYIEIDGETFKSAPSNIRVVNGKLKIYNVGITRKLVPSNIGTPCSPQDICVVVDHTEPNQQWTVKTYEAD